MAGNLFRIIKLTKNQPGELKCEKIYSPKLINGLCSQYKFCHVAISGYVVFCYIIVIISIIVTNMYVNYILPQQNLTLNSAY